MRKPTGSREKKIGQKGLNNIWKILDWRKYKTHWINHRNENPQELKHCQIPGLTTWYYITCRSNYNTLRDYQKRRKNYLMVSARHSVSTTEDKWDKPSKGLLTNYVIIYSTQFTNFYHHSKQISIPGGNKIAITWTKKKAEKNHTDVKNNFLSTQWLLNTATSENKISAHHELITAKRLRVFLTPGY